MIQTSQAFIEAVNQSSRQWRARFLYNGADTGATTKSIMVKSGSMSETALNLCGVFSSSLEATIDTLDGYDWNNKEITVQLGLVLADESIEWINLGVFTIIETQQAKYTTTLIGIGALGSGGNLPFGTNEVAPTIGNVINLIASIIGKGVDYDTSFSTAMTELISDKPIENITCIEALQMVVSCLGGFAYDTADGIIKIAPYPAQPTATTTTERMTEEPTFGAYQQILGVKVIVKEASVAEDGTPIPEVAYQDAQEYTNAFINPYMTQDLFDNFFAPNIDGLVWNIANLPIALGDPRIEPIDMLSITVDSETYNVPCHNIVQYFDGGLKTIVTACGESTAKADTYSGGQVTKQLKTLTADIIRVDKAIAETIEIGGHFFVGNDGYIHITETENAYTTGNNILVDSDSVDIRRDTTTVASFGEVTRIGEQGKSGVAFNSTETVFYDAQGSEAAHIGQGVTIVKKMVETYAGGPNIISTSQPLRVSCLLSDIAIIDSENSIAVGIIFASGSSRYNFTMTISSADTDFTATRGIFTFTVNYSSTLNRISVIVSASSTVSNLSRISVTCTYNYTGLAPTYTFGLGLEATAPYSFIVGQYNEDNYTLFAVGNGTDDNNRHNVFEIDTNGVTINDGDFSVVNGTTSVGELWTDEIRASGTITAEKNIYFDSTNRGLFGMDYADFAYPLICDNGTNLWIGATQSSAQHHTGATYISSGYNSSLGEGYESVFVSVPNATNTGASQYAVYHKGNLTNATTSDSGLMSSADKTKLNKLSFASGLANANFGDGSNTDQVWVWGNDTNKVGVGALNTTDNKRYNILARADRLRLYNTTDSSTEWEIFPITSVTGNNNGKAIASTSLASASIAPVANFTVSAGLYLVIVYVKFPNNATGRRYINLSKTSGGSTAKHDWATDDRPAVSGAITTCRIVCTLEATANETYYINAYQNSGGSLNVTGSYNVLRIG